MTIHKEGFAIIRNTALGLIVINLLLLVLFPSSTEATKIIAFFSFIVFLPVLNFFRLPKNTIICDEKSVFSPADGKVVVIEPVEETEYFNEKRLQVSVFMSVTNVHVNWFPINGIIKYYKHHNGRFMAAYLPKSSAENERSTVVLENSSKVEILVRQIAGALARRIVTYAEKNATVKQNEQLGFIKFGSRVDVFLPLDAEIKVAIGDKVQGGRSVIAKL